MYTSMSACMYVDFCVNTVVLRVPVHIIMILNMF